MLMGMLGIGVVATQHIREEYDEEDEYDEDEMQDESKILESSQFVRPNTQLSKKIGVDGMENNLIQLNHSMQRANFGAVPINSQI